jgi:hypothetical protein
MPQLHYARVYLGTILAMASVTNGATILQYSAGVLPTGGPIIFGESFTTPNAGSWNNITFNFADGPAPAAFGTAFLLSTSYSGTPAALSPATSGFLASANTAKGIYTFPSTLVLQPGTTYYLYSNAFFGPVTGGPSAVPGVTTYFADTLNTNFAPTSGALNFLLAGSTLAQAPLLTAPEPATIWLVLLALASLELWHRRRKTTF